MPDGKVYEKFVNKFLKGNIVSELQKYYDVETKTTIYEVKGCHIIHQRSLGRYKIKLKNHSKLLEISQQINKIPKYVFVLKIDGRMIWKTFSWKAIDLGLKNSLKHKNKDDIVYNLRLKDIW